jgi:hypothetical protein
VVKRRRWTIVAATLAAATLAAVAAWLALPPGPTAEPMPDPNGFDDVAEAAGMIEGQPPAVGELTGMTYGDLRHLVEAGRAALDRARVGLGRDSRVRMPASVSDPTYLEKVGRFKALARLFAAEAALAGREGRTADAAAGYADLGRLGRVVALGGLAIDTSNGQAIERMGLDGLDRLVPNLPADVCRRLIAELGRQERGREAFARVMKRDQEFSRAKSPWFVKAALAINPSMFRSLTQPVLASGEFSERTNLARLRMTGAALALRAYRLEHPGAPPPTDLTALVPAALPAVPRDPFSDGPLRVKAGDDGVRVYSVGPDGRDDGGTPVAPDRPFNPGSTGDLVVGPF